MAVTDTIHSVGKMSAEERQARLDAIFAKRDAAIAAGMEIWDYDKVNQYLREQRGGGEAED